MILELTGSEQQNNLRRFFLNLIKRPRSLTTHQPSESNNNSVNCDSCIVLEYAKSVISSVLKVVSDGNFSKTESDTSSYIVEGW